MTRTLLFGMVFVLSACGTKEVTHTDSVLPDGIYEVVASAASADALPSASSDTRVLRYDRRFVQGGDEVPPDYLLVRLSGFAPLDLAEPAKPSEMNGRPVLLLALESEASAALTALTTHAKAMAIVIGGEVTSSHRVREPLRGGRLQVSC